MTIVVDTNVFISSQLKQKGNEAQLFNLWVKGWFDIAVSDSILEEYQRVLEYPHIQKRLQWSRRKIADFIVTLKQSSYFVPGIVEVEPLKKDPTDTKFLACAVEIRADGIVTGDKKHLLPLRSFQGIPIITPKFFLDTLREAKQS